MRPFEGAARNCTLLLAPILACAFPPFASARQTPPKPDQPAKAQEARTAKPQATDITKEAFVIEHFQTRISFEADATGTREVSAVIHLQSDAAVREFGILHFPYVADSETVEVLSVQVKKPDGSVVVTPASHVRDLPDEVTREAPTYSDLREKQVPVRALGSGDTLEYKARWTRTKSEFGGHIWYTHDFFEAGPVLDETLEVSLPEQQYIAYSSPNHKAIDERKGGRRILSWKETHTQTKSESDDAEASDDEDSKKPAHSVQITGFRNWEEVGDWYRKLAEPSTVVTPAITAKARELTQGLATKLEKEKALYQYVSGQFRYISISFGVGRYQPHAADEVLAEQYGDCKDKHTLFAALLKAAGIEAWPVLIGAGIKLNPDVPSPGQFNHVITVIPSGDTFEWLDTTSGVAPFGALESVIRDEQALVIPSAAAPFLRKTPEALPFQSLQKYDVKGSLDAEGTLTAHFDLTWRGDAEMLIRAGFQATPESQWNNLMQTISAGTGFGGKVTNTKVESLEDTSKPLHLSYDYSRENYADWANLRTMAPLPPIGLPNPDGKEPKKPFGIGTVGEISLHSEIHLPDGFNIEIPAEARMRTDFADYTAADKFANGVLSSTRTLKVLTAKVPVKAWPDCQKLARAAYERYTQQMPLSRTSGKPVAVETVSNPEAERLVKQAFEALERNDRAAAAKALDEAERLNPKQRLIWTVRAGIDMMAGDKKAALDAERKDVELHPADPEIRLGLCTLMQNIGSADEASNCYKEASTTMAGNPMIAHQYSRLLLTKKNYEEAAKVAQDGLTVDPKNEALKEDLLNALLGSGNKEEGVALAKKLLKDTEAPMTQNNVAWALVESNTDLPFALDWVTKSVRALEEGTKDLDVNALAQEDLWRMNSLGAAWDTLGWVYFRMGDLDKAESYLIASWQLIQHAATADHLGDLYEKQGKKDAAIHYWQLAASMDAQITNPREKLKNAGKVVPEGPKPYPTLRSGPRSPNALEASLGEELGKMRTFPLPLMKRTSGSAEFFLVFSNHGPTQTRFISGEDSMRDAEKEVAAAKVSLKMPDDGPVRLVRRAILSCSKYTNPNCQLVFIPSEVTGLN